MIEVRPALLRWARERARLTPGEVAERTGASETRVTEWEETGRLRRRQLERLAQATHTPVGLLYLATPPDEQLPIPDFRTVGDQLPVRPSPDLLDTLDDAERRQAWYRDYLIAVGSEPLGIVGSISENTRVADAAQAIANFHGFTVDARRATGSWEEGLRKDIERLENTGILVLRNGVVGSNTHRRLDAQEFRGFALVDEYAPLIFVNGRDAKAAQLFTIAHELVHVWLGRSGVSNFDHTLPADNAVERFSNKVAAELVVPANQVQDLWALYGSDVENLQALVRYFRVSSLVVLRRLFDLRLIDWEVFRMRYEAEEARFTPQRDAEDEGGGDFYRTQTARVSKRFAQALIGDVLAGRTSWRQAFSFLGIRNPETFNEFARHLGFGL